MAVTTADEFLEVLQSSEILTAEQIARAREAAGESADPKVMAKTLVKQGTLTRWQAGVLLFGKSSLKIGKYTLLEQIATGELGNIYLAEHAQMGRRVAIKTLSKKLSANAAAVERFLHSAREAASLDHRNVVHVYDVASEDERYYMVMEYIDGRDLETLVKEQGPLAAGAACGYVRQAAEGLAHAHERKLVHRDICPANVLVDAQGNVKLLNVGVGLLQANGKPQAGGARDGYAAPELASGGEADARSDLFALGRLLQFLLTGKPQTPTPAEAPTAVKEAVSRLTADDPAARCGSAQEAAKLLAPLAAEAAGKPAPAAAPKAEQSLSGEFEAPARDSDFSISVGPSRGARFKGKGKGADEPEETPAAEEAPAFGPVIQTSAAKRKPGVRNGAEAAAPTAAAPAVKPKAGRPEPTPKGVAVKGPAVKGPAAKGRAAKPSAEKGAATAGGLNPKLLIGLAAGAGGVALLLLAALIAVLVWAFSGGDDPVAAGPTDGSVAAPAVEPEEGPVPATDGEAPDAAVDAGGADSGTGEADGASVDAGGAGDPGATAGATDPAVPPTQPAPPGPDPAVPPAVAPTPDPAPMPTPPTDPAPPTPATMPPTDPAPMPTPPQPPAQPPAAAANLFAGLPPAVELPIVDDEAPEDAWKPMEWGALATGDGARLRLYLTLLGGEHAIKGGKQVFSLEAADGGVSENEWDFRLGPAADPASGAVVARLSLQEGKLSFQWRPEAKEDETSNFLRNCMIQFRSGQFEHVLGLRKTTEIEPLTVDFQDSMQQGIEIPYVPDVSALRVEIALAKDVFPKHSVVRPQRPGQDPALSTEYLLADKDKLVYSLGDHPEIRPLYFEVLTQMKQRDELTVSVVPWFVSAPNARPSKFVRRQAEQAASAMQLTAQGLQAQAQAIDPSKIQDQQQKERATQQKNLTQQQAEGAGKWAAELAKLPGLYDALQQKAPIYIRVYFESDGRQVELARAKGFPAPAPAK